MRIIAELKVGVSRPCRDLTQISPKKYTIGRICRSSLTGYSAAHESSLLVPAYRAGAGLSLAPAPRLCFAAETRGARGREAPDGEPAARIA